MTNTDLSTVHGSESGLPAGSWRTASYCGPNGGNCVEVNRGASDLVGVADSKPAQRSPLSFAVTPWDDFLADARSGRFDH